MTTEKIMENLLIIAENLNTEDRKFLIMCGITILIKVHFPVSGRDLENFILLLNLNAEPKRQGNLGNPASSMEWKAF